MVLKWGRFGQFLTCSGYPECKTTREIRRLAGRPAAGGDRPTRSSGGARPDRPKLSRNADARSGRSASSRARATPTAKPPQIVMQGGQRKPRCCSTRCPDAATSSRSAGTFRRVHRLLELPEVHIKMKETGVPAPSAARDNLKVAEEQAR
jgi:hypothetical protein